MVVREVGLRTTTNYEAVYDVIRYRSTVYDIDTGTTEYYDDVLRNLTTSLPRCWLTASGGCVFMSTFERAHLFVFEDPRVTQDVLSGTTLVANLRLHVQNGPQKNETARTSARVAYLFLKLCWTPL